MVVVWLMILLFVSEMTSSILQVFHVQVGIRLIVASTVADLAVDVVEVDQDLVCIDLVTLFDDEIEAAVDQVLDIELDGTDDSNKVVDMTVGIAENADIDTLDDTVVSIEGFAAGIVVDRAVADPVAPIADNLTADVYDVVDKVMRSEVMYLVP